MEEIQINKRAYKFTVDTCCLTDRGVCTQQQWHREDSINLKESKKRKEKMNEDKTINFE
jgi:hypothetical protein